MRHVPERIPRPAIITIYFDPDRALVPTIPTDLQLIVYFTIYNYIAKGKFFELKSSAQPLDISRAIWYYGVDKGHAFAMFSHHIRGNVIIMAFLWSSGFDTRYCEPGCGDSNDEKKMKKRIETLSKKLNNTENLPKHDDFVAAVRSGKITPELFEQFGPALALQWVMQKEGKGKADQENIDEANDVKQANLDLDQARKDVAASTARLRRMEERRAAGLPLDEEDTAIAHEPTFDPFPDIVHPGMGHVAWDQGILKELRFPLEAEPMTTKQVEKARPKFDKTTSYITPDQIFNGVFELKTKAEECDGPGYETLVSMLGSKLL
ncbi:hypothetical protein CC86DRAFT_451884 [Ophiobolus disseminans]|uniref:Uncharacterized protein n=1 Tax=Ophiobolus disseminans TaxID=1469910 RepID=A0A6A7AGA6_9PLEO|nr:hypothetical protein CC86DRAFT_451884 [Ophiobolus disseminans]